MSSRIRLGIPLNDAICVVDTAAALGVEVRFDAIPSLEGMYVKAEGHRERALIVVSSLRPAGRRAMTIGHELGHHSFGHGTRIDEYLRIDRRASLKSGYGNFEIEEFLADSFGALLTMTPSAVLRGFSARGLRPETSSPAELYFIAGWLGVGYTSLIYHLQTTLRLISYSRAQMMLKMAPKEIRAELLGRQLDGDVYLVDKNWTGRPVDMQVGDIALVRDKGRIEAHDGSVTTRKRCPLENVDWKQGCVAVQAVSPGIGRIVGDDWATFVRVSKAAYTGRSVYRHLEECDSPQQTRERSQA